MGTFAVGEIVAVDFPLSDLSGSKKRPAIVLAKADFDNYILCQVMSRVPDKARNFVHLADTDVVDSKLLLQSFARIDKIFTADPRIISTRLGHLRPSKKAEVLSILAVLFSGLGLGRE